MFIADQASKAWAVAALGGERWALAPMLDLVLRTNTGAAFSLLGDAGGWQRWFFVTLSAGISLLLLWLWRLPEAERRSAPGLALVLGGALGNLADRLRLGHVIDFIDFHLPAVDGGCLPLFYGPVGGACHFPTFNIADSAITVGAVWLLAAGWLDRRR